MKILPFILMLFMCSCYKRGADSKKVRLWSYNIVGDGNDNDSTFFHIRIRNENSVPLIEPKLKFVAKDPDDNFFTSSFYHTQTLTNISANSIYDHYIYYAGAEEENPFEKVKIRLEWKNSEDKTSVRRYVEHY